MDRSLSALLAVRNVQCTLRTTVFEILDLMSELTSRFELVLVDDCSTDATIEVADELAAVYPQLFVLRHETPLGYWNSLRAALGRSLGECVLFPDEDRVAAWDQIGRLWTFLGECDLVVGRLHGSDRAGETTPPIVRPSGGFLLGQRRFVAAAADCLGNWCTFWAKLMLLGARWREVSLPLPAWRRWQLPTAVREAGSDAPAPASRSLRQDRPEAIPSAPVFFETSNKKSSSPSWRLLYPATDLLE